MKIGPVEAVFAKFAAKMTEIRNEPEAEAWNQHLSEREPAPVEEIADVNFRKDPTLASGL